MKEFLKKLQESGENTKMAISVSLTGVFLIAILFALSLNSGASLTGFEREEEPGVFKTLKVGVVAVLDIIRLRTANTIQFFKEKFEAKNTLYIEDEEEAAKQEDSSLNQANASENLQQIKLLFAK